MLFPVGTIILLHELEENSTQVWKKKIICYVCKVEKYKYFDKFVKFDKFLKVNKFVKGDKFVQAHHDLNVNSVFIFQRSKLKLLTNKYFR